jgi:hypothetical protein
METHQIKMSGELTEELLKFTAGEKEITEPNVAKE